MDASDAAGKVVVVLEGREEDIDGLLLLLLLGTLLKLMRCAVGGWHMKPSVDDDDIIPTNSSSSGAIESFVLRSGFLDSTSMVTESCGV